MTEERDIAPDPAPSMRWIILGVMYMCIISFAFAFQSIPPVLSLIMAELNLSHAQAGLLMSFFALPGIIVSIPAGLLADRYSQKTIGIISLAVMIAGTATVAAGGSLAALLAGRVLAGIGSATLVVIVPQLLAQWFLKQEMGIAMGVFNTGMPVGTVLSLNFLSALGARLGWRASVWAGAGVSLLTLAVFILLFSPRSRNENRAPLSARDLWGQLIADGPPVWTLGSAWLFFNAAVISVYTFTPALLKSTGFSIASAGFYTSVIMWPGILMGLLIGWLIDKKDFKRLMIGCAGIALSLLLLQLPALTLTAWMVPLMVSIGMTQSFIPTPIFALVPELVHPSRLGLGYGILSVCVNIGIMAGPFAAGWIKDVSGSYQASYRLMSALALLVAFSMLVLGRKKTEGTARRL